MKIIKTIKESFKLYIEQRRQEKKLSKFLPKTYKINITKEQVDLLIYCAEMGIKNINDLKIKFNL